VTGWNIFYKTKSKHILETAKILKTKYKCKIPHNIDKLMELPGVGRKTANVILGNAFGVPGIPVDTHVHRISRRIQILLYSTQDQKMRWDRN
jgi:endonuclease-3